MRPKKKVLLYCQDEERLSRTAFVLWSKSYAVTTINSELSLFSLLMDWDGDCAVLIETDEDDQCRTMAQAIRRERPSTKIGIVYQTGPRTVPKADSVLVGTDVNNFVGMVKDLCSRKPGPKKFTKIWNYDEVPG